MQEKKQEISLDKSPIKKRMIQYLKYKDLKPNDAYKDAGISRGIFGQNNGISEENLARFLDCYKDVNPVWLLTEEEPMLKPDENQSVEILSPDLLREQLYKLTNYKPPAIVDLVPYYGVDFTAGNAVATFDDQTIQPEYYMDIPDFRGCKAFRAYSDSMEPAIKSGSILFGTKLSDVSSAEFGQVYGIVLNDGRRMLKYLRRHPEDPSSYFLLASENKVYDDMEIKKESVKSLWLIHGHLSKRI